MIYQYEAKDETGKTVTGHLEGENERLVASRLRDMGYFPMRVARQNMPVRSTGGGTLGIASTQLSAMPGQIAIWTQPKEHWFKRGVLFPLWTGVSMPDVAFFYRQMAAMVNAGVPIYRALTSIEEQTRSGLLRKIVHQIGEHVQAGGNLTDALAQFPYVFTDLQRAMIGVAEQTGGLDIMFGRVSEYIEREYALRQMIKRETFYPKMVLVLSLLLPSLYLFVPGQGGPAAYFHTAVLPLIAIVGGIGILYTVSRYAMQSETLRVAYDAIKSYLPYFGSTVRMLSLAKFARALAALYSAGVPVQNAMVTASEVAGNAYLAAGMRRAAEAMVGGASISESFHAAKVFPPMITSMVSTGETTGSLDAMLEKAADYYEGEAGVRLHKSAQVLGVLALLVAAVVVGYEVIKFYTGYFNNIMSAGDGN